MWRHDLKLFACRGGYNRAPWHSRELKERHRMRIWVDADACPVVIKEILFRAAERAAVSLTLVANKPLRVPRSPHIRTVQVAGDPAVRHVETAGDLHRADMRRTRYPQRLVGDQGQAHRGALGRTEQDLLADTRASLGVGPNPHAV